MRVESGLLNIETEQYAGQGQEGLSIGHLAAAARKMEELGFDGATMPEAGHDPFLPLVVAAEHTQRIALAHQRRDRLPAQPDDRRADWRGTCSSSPAAASISGSARR